jgi:hypothetical protein
MNWADFLGLNAVILPILPQAKARSASIKASRGPNSTNPHIPAVINKETGSTALWIWSI